jgi:hypothetical protein
MGKALSQVQKIAAVAAALKILQAHGDGCGCWECADSSAIIRQYPATVAALRPLWPR